MMAAYRADSQSRLTVLSLSLHSSYSFIPGMYSFFRAVRSWSLRLSALMDSDLAWVNGKSAR